MVFSTLVIIFLFKRLQEFPFVSPLYILTLDGHKCCFLRELCNKPYCMCERETGLQFVMSERVVAYRVRSTNRGKRSAAEMVCGKINFKLGDVKTSQRYPEEKIPTGNCDQAWASNILAKWVLNMMKHTDTDVLIPTYGRTDKEDVASGVHARSTYLVIDATNIGIISLFEICNVWPADYKVIDK